MSNWRLADSLKQLRLLTFFRSVFTGTLSPAGVAYSIAKYILSRKRMTVYAGNLLCIDRATSIGAHKVFFLRNRFQVRRVYANNILAKVVNSQPFGDCAMPKFIRNPMRWRITQPAALTERSIAIAIFAALPFPAIFWQIHFYFRPKAFRYRLGSSFRFTGSALVGCMVNAFPASRTGVYSTLTHNSSLLNRLGCV